MNPEEYISIRICGDIDPNIVAKMGILKHEQPELFNRYKSKLDAYPIEAYGRKLPKSKLIEMQTAVIHETRVNHLYTSGYAACDTFSAVAVFSKSQDLQKAAHISKVSLDFTKQLGLVKEVMLSKIVSFDSLLNPTLMLASIGAQIFGFFQKKSGPSIDEIMFKQLEEISQQISDLHEDMSRRFGEVHKHLELLHEGIIECRIALEILINTKIDGMRNSTGMHLDQIQRELRALTLQVHTGQVDILTLDLKKLCTKADAIVNADEADVPAVKVKKIMESLLNDWALDYAAAPSQNGASKFVRDDNSRDDAILSYEDANLDDKLRFMAEIVKECGLNLGDTVNENNIININLFNLAVSKYIMLAHTFPEVILNDEYSNQFRHILNFAANTQDFVRNVQNNEELFIKLFVDYDLAEQQMHDTITAQIALADKNFKTEQNIPEINLSDPFTTMLSNIRPYKAESFAAEANLPEQFTLSTNLLTCQDSLNLPPVMSLAVKLKLANCTSTYTGTQRYPVHLGVDYGWVWEQNLFVKRFIDGEKYFSKLTSVQGNYQVGRHRINLSLNYRFQHPTLLATNAALPVYSVNIADANNVSCYSFSVECGETRSTNALAAFNNLLRKFHYIGNVQPQAYLDFVDTITHELKTTLCALRRRTIITPLIENESKAFNIALRNLESAKRRIIAFADLAGFSEEFRADCMRGLLDRQSVRNFLSAYRLTDNLDAPYWQGSNSHALRIEALNAIRVNLRAPELHLHSRILQKISNSLARVRIANATHASNLRFPHLIHKGTRAKALELGLDINQLKLTPGLNTCQPLFALFTAILDNNYARAKFICTNMRGLSLNTAVGSKSIISLHIACYWGAHELVNILLDADPSTLDTPDADGYTALMYAIMSGSAQTVQSVLNRNPDRRAVNINNDTAQSIAIQYGQLEADCMLRKLDEQDRSRLRCR